MWAKVAEEMQVPWRAAEAMHWQLGEMDMARRAGVVPFSLNITSNEPQGPQRTSPTSYHAHSSYQPLGLLPGIVELTTGFSPYGTSASACCNGSGNSSSGGGVPPLPPPLPPGGAGPGYTTSPIPKQSHSHNGTASPGGTFFSTVLSSSSSSSTCPPLEMKLALVHHPPSSVRPLLVPTRLVSPIPMPPASYQAPVISAPVPSKRTFPEAFRGEATVNAAWRDPSDELAQASGKRQRLTPLAAAGENLLCVWSGAPREAPAVTITSQLQIQSILSPPQPHDPKIEQGSGRKRLRRAEDVVSLAAAQSRERGQSVSAASGAEEIEIPQRTSPTYDHAHSQSQGSLLCDSPSLPSSGYTRGPPPPTNPTGHPLSYQPPDYSYRPRGGRPGLFPASLSSQHAVPSLVAAAAALAVPSRLLPKQRE